MSTYAKILYDSEGNYVLPYTRDTLVYSGNTTIADAYLKRSGGTMTGTLYFGSTSYYINSSGNAKFNTAYGAVFNDYAEFFPRGEETEPGDIIALDVSSDEERYVKAKIGNTKIVGVHSDEYAYLIGGDDADTAEEFITNNLKKYIPVGLVGRVHVKVIGAIHTGDWIVPSDIPGVGMASKDSTNAVGYSVETNNSSGIRRIKIKLGR